MLYIIAVANKTGSTGSVCHRDFLSGTHHEKADFTGYGHRHFPEVGRH